MDIKPFGSIRPTIFGHQKLHKQQIQDDFFNDNGTSAQISHISEF